MTIDTAPDLRVAGVALAATAFAALLGGLLPAVRLSRTNLQANLAGAGRTTGGRPARRLAGSLVVAQLALSLLLLASTGLLIRTMARIASIDPGFRPEHVVAIDLRDESPAGTAKAEIAARCRAVEQRLHQIPGVESASLSWLGLFGGNDLGIALLDPERPDHINVHVDYVSARYFETAGMRIRRGRGFSEGDVKGAPRVAVINEALVRARFADREPIGRRVSIDYKGEEEPFTIVGVVADSKYNDLREKTTDPMMWMPMQQAFFKPTFAMLRTRAGSETAVGRQAREVFAATAPLMMIRKIATLSEQVDRATRRQRLLLGLAAAFGWAALVLAAIGLYGSLAFAVTQRTREIGVRMALGAQPAAVLRSIVAGAMVYVAWAVGIGLPLTWVTGRTLKGFLFGVEPLDWVSLGGACVVLGLAAVAAAYLPARRAAGIDPIAALRYE
jgi:putative ABC transport system permease protein